MSAASGSGAAASAAQSSKQHRMSRRADCQHPPVRVLIKLVTRKRRRLRHACSGPGSASRAPGLASVFTPLAPVFVGGLEPSSRTGEEHVGDRMTQGSLARGIGKLYARPDVRTARRIFALVTTIRKGMSCPCTAIRACDPLPTRTASRPSKPICDLSRRSRHTRCRFVAPALFKKVSSLSILHAD